MVSPSPSPSPPFPSLTYRNAGPWGSGKGAPLSSNEGDNNIYNLDLRTTELETLMPEAGRGIETVVLASGTSNMMLVYYTDGTVSAPIELPAATYRSRGEWANDTDYFVNDIIYVNGATYPVTFDHHTPVSGDFDAGANSGPGNDWYGEPWIVIPGSSLPNGGTTGQVLTKFSNSDFDTHWTSPAQGTPGGGSNGQVLTWRAGNRVWETKPPLALCARVSAADLVDGKPQYFRAPITGIITQLDATVQEDMEFGGTLDLRVNGMSGGLFLVIEDGAAAGSVYSTDDASPPFDGYPVTAGYTISVVPLDFVGPSPGLSPTPGAVNLVIMIVPE